MGRCHCIRGDPPGEAPGTQNFFVLFGGNPAKVAGADVAWTFEHLRFTLEAVPGHQRLVHGHVPACVFHKKAMSGERSKSVASKPISTCEMCVNRGKSGCFSGGFMFRRYSEPAAWRTWTLNGRIPKLTQSEERTIMKPCVLLVGVRHLAGEPGSVCGASANRRASDSRPSKGGRCWSATS